MLMSGRGAKGKFPEIQSREQDPTKYVNELRVKGEIMKFPS
jgi:hypothetical protein